MYIITLVDGVLVGTTTRQVMEYLTRDGDYQSAVWIDDLDEALDTVDYVEE